MSDKKYHRRRREAAAHDELFKALLEELMTERLRAGALIERRSAVFIGARRDR